MTSDTLDYDTLYPQIDTLEIQTSNLLYNQETDHESEHFFQNQAEPFYSSSFAMESIEVPEVPDLPIGEVIPSVDAVGWSDKGYNVDIRPRLVDSSTGEARLLDSGAQLSATKKGPTDKLDESVRLVAVNGSRIPTYGTKDITIKIHRKTDSKIICICKSFFQ